MIYSFLDHSYRECIIYQDVFHLEPHMSQAFTAYVEWDPETRLYVGIIPDIPGAHTQGATLDELKRNLKEVLELCLEERDRQDLRKI